MVRLHSYNEAKISLIGACRVDIHGQTDSIFMFLRFNDRNFSVFSRSLVRNALSWADEERCHVTPHQTPAAQPSHPAAAPHECFSHIFVGAAQQTPDICSVRQSAKVAVQDPPLYPNENLFVYV